MDTQGPLWSTPNLRPSKQQMGEAARGMEMKGDGVELRPGRSSGPVQGELPEESAETVHPLIFVLEPTSF